MPDEALITQIENIMSEVVALGGSNERTSIVPNLTVQDANPAGLTGFIVVSDDRDGDNIIAKKVGSVIYSDNDLVNVMFLEGAEAIAFQQGSQSANSGIWEIVAGTSTDIFYDKGDVGINNNAPIVPLDVTGTVQITDDIQHAGDTDTKIGFTTDDVEITVGNLSMLKLTEAAQDEITLGPGSGDVDIDFNGDMSIEGLNGRVAVNQAAIIGARVAVFEDNFETVINTAIRAEVDTSNTSAANYQSVAVFALNEYGGTNTNTNANGVRAVHSSMFVDNTNTTLRASGNVLDSRNTSTGTVTNLIGTRVLTMQNSGGGTVTNIYGHRVETQTAATNNYGFYQAGSGLNVFEDTVGIGTSTIPHGGVGSARFAMEGADASEASGPHMQFTTAADNYPLIQHLNFGHDNVSLNFDAYFSSGWKSSYSGSNFSIIKLSDIFRINYDSGIAQGNTVTWNPGIVLDTSGQVGIGTAAPSTRLDINAGAMELAEMTAPGGGAANTCRIYAEDNGAGKTRLMAIFNTGAAQQIAIEP